MNTMIDILGASLIGSIIVLLMLNLNLFSAQVKFSSDSDLRLAGNAKTFAEILDSDLRKIGFKHNGTAIITAQPKKISYYSDLDNNGTDDIVTLALSDSTEVPYTPNPHDKILYRIVNNDTSAAPSLDVTDLKFTYYNSLGSVTTNLDSIKSIKAEIYLQSPEKVDYQGKAEYLNNYWEITVNPRNL